MFSSSTVLLLGWGALAFGAEYSWAYAPLLVFFVVVGVLGLLASAGGHVPARSLGFALAAIFVGGLLQLVPLSERTIRMVSPASVVADYRQLYAKVTMRPLEPTVPSDGGALRPMSIAPSRTVLGLAFLAAFTMLLVGSARGISAVGPGEITRGILVLGVVVALVNLVQHTLGSETVYGFWYPPKGGVQPFAPFINHNHTAGWLLMALSLSAGYFAGAVARGMHGVKPDWRHRILWLSSRDASETLLSGFAIAAMAIAVVVTASRSGSICLALMIVMFSWWVTRRQPSAPRKMIVFAHLLVVLFAAISLGGIEVLAGRFSLTSWSNLDGRLDVWEDTIRIVRDFPLTGTGLNTYGIAMLHYQTVQDGAQYIEAHNDYLQIVAEGGLLLGLPILLSLMLFMREVWRRFREENDDTATYWLRAGAVVGLCAIATQAVVDFTLQMPGAAVLFVVLAAIAIHRPAHLLRGGPLRGLRDDEVNSSSIQASDGDEESHLPSGAGRRRDRP